MVPVLWSLCAFAFPVYSQITQEETLAGPDAHEIASPSYLLGGWAGERARLLERGVKFDFQYLNESFWNLKSEQKERFTSWERVRGTVDIDLGAWIEQPGWSFHATALWQGGSDVGAYLDLLADPSGIASVNTFRLDSWWVQKQWLDERLTVRAGQFAGEDSYGDQNYGTSFVFEPMSYAFGNLATTQESYSPPSTPAFEIRFVPIHHVYVKSMVVSGEPSQFSHNPTGLVPQFRGDPVSVSEIGFTSGKRSSAIRPADNATTRRGYTGLYKFGASYNPLKFPEPASLTLRSSNYLLYAMANQALWRVDPREAKGLDGTFGYDWSPPSVNRNNTELMAGLRFNEPLPIHLHNTMSLGYVQNGLSQLFLSPGMPAFKTEHGAEFNTLFVLGPFLWQPVIQYYANAGGGVERAVVVGFRIKVEL
jgi:carbohydrate-selective porin OprB